MRFSISGHARKEMTRRGIESKDLDLLMTNPGQIVDADDELVCYQSQQIIHDVINRCAWRYPQKPFHQGATKAHTRSGLQLRRNAGGDASARNPPGGCPFGGWLCRSSVKDRYGYSPSSLRASHQKSMPRHPQLFMTPCIRTEKHIFCGQL
jgi:hypothetical protein